MDRVELNVGAVVRINWSNGAGWSDYRVEDDPGSGPHQLVLIGEQEVGRPDPNLDWKPPVLR